MTNRSAKNNLLGCLPKALSWNFVIGALALLISVSLGGPKIYIKLSTAIAVFCAMLVPYIALTWWSITALARGRASASLVTDGPYRWTRHPMYAAIIFILNPALGILFRSWILFLAAIPAYFIWRHCVRAEEIGPLPAKFGDAYFAYEKNTARFFPKLRQLNQFLFYGLAGALIFLVSFIFLNSSALYLRWVAFETHGEIAYDDPAPKKSSFPLGQYSWPNSSPPPDSLASTNNTVNYNENPDSIIISRLGIRAPLIQARGPSQKELNNALNQGVIIYPGSVRPGEDGEVVLSGHSSIFPWVKSQYGQVFTLLDKLKPGDTVSIVFNHYQYDYLITGQAVLNPNQVTIGQTNQAILKLVTCWPIGTSAKRLVVYGELIK